MIAWFKFWLCIECGVVRPLVYLVLEISVVKSLISCKRVFLHFIWLLFSFLCNDLVDHTQQTAGENQSEILMCSHWPWVSKWFVVK